MPSSRNKLLEQSLKKTFICGAIQALAVLTWGARAQAQQTPQGFAVERFYPSAPGGGWFVMDALDIHGGLGGTMAVTTGYARNPLKVNDGTTHVAVVSDQAVTDFGFAATYDRWRVYLNLDVPMTIKGDSGTVGAYQLTAPNVDVASNPDTLSDARVGFDARILGAPKGPFRLGAGAQLFVPNGNRGDYDTDGTFRAMIRALFAGDVGRYFAYAGHVGVHIRPLDDSPAPGSPQGSELLFGLAAGGRVPVGKRGAFVFGPEVYGATAFQSFMGSTSTALEGLLTGRFEGTAEDGPQLRVKLGGGGGLDQHFGAAEWRLVFSLEVFGHQPKK